MGQWTTLIYFIFPYVRFNLSSFNNIVTGIRRALLRWGSSFFLHLNSPEEAIVWYRPVPAYFGSSWRKITKNISHPRRVYDSQCRTFAHLSLGTRMYESWYRMFFFFLVTFCFLYRAIFEIARNLYVCLHLIKINKQLSYRWNIIIYDVSFVYV